jgi:hypothetical protein
MFEKNQDINGDRSERSDRNDLIILSFSKFCHIGGKKRVLSTFSMEIEGRWLVESA